MSHLGFSEIQKPLQIPSRDSLELASLAESDEQEDLPTSESSSRSGIASSRKLSFENEDPLDSSNPAGRRPDGRRSYSVSSAFDFTPALFPLSSTAGGYTALGAPSTTSLPLDRYGASESLEKHKTLTYLNGLSLVVGLIIGSGIFSSPSQVNSYVGSPGASLVVWTISGLLTWTGASSYAELGGAIPLNGGAQVYLSKIFGELAGFLFTWTSILVLKPGSAAIIAIILGEYTVRAFIGADVVEVNPWINKAPAFTALNIVTLFNCLSTRLSARIGDLFMFFKFVALLAVAVIGVVVAATGLSFNSPANTDWKTQGWFNNTSTNLSNWAVALYAGLWAFDGWDNTNYVTGEFKNPSRDLPRVIHTAMPLVILCYLLANVSYIFVLPLSQINSSNTVAVQFGNKVFGPWGSLVLAIIVSASLLRRPQRHRLHRLPPRLRRRPRRLHSLRLRQHRPPGLFLLHLFHLQPTLPPTPTTPKPPHPPLQTRHLPLPPHPPPPGPLLHPDQRPHPQRPHDRHLHRPRRVPLPHHLLRRRRLLLLLPDCPRLGGPTHSRTEPRGGRIGRGSRRRSAFAA